jgi:hypothetical protein
VIGTNDYRSIYCRIVDDPQFQALSANAKLLWYTLKVSHECGPLNLFRFYRGMFIERTGLCAADFDAAMNRLIDDGYLFFEQGYVLIHNGMRYEPNFRPAKDPKHLAHVYAQLGPLKGLALTLRLLDENDLPVPEGWGIEDPSKGLRRGYQGSTKPLGSTDPQTETEREPQRNSCAEPPEDGRSSPAVPGFPCVGKAAKTWDLTEVHLRELQEAYPGIDARAEALKARQWCRDNPTKRKTAKGMPRFLNGWFAKEQNRGPVGRTTTGPICAAPPPVYKPEPIPADCLEPPTPEQKQRSRDLMAKLGLVRSDEAEREVEA